MESFIGQIILWPIAWVPEGWALCDGSLLPIQPNAALYSLLGVRYGGNGSTTFGLPNLCGRVPVGSQNVGANVVTSGSATATVSGNAAGNITIGVANLPGHTHPAVLTPGAAQNVSVAIPAASAALATTDTPGTAVIPGKIAGTAGGKPMISQIYSAAASDTTLKPFNVSVPGDSATVAVNANTGGQALAVSLPLNGATVNVMQPYQTLNYIICTQGIYPNRP